MSVRQIEVPAEARALSTLDRIDYGDAFLVDVGAVRDRTAEQWARAIFDGAPNSVRRKLWWAWRVLGLRLGSPRSKRHVLGWEVRRSTADFVLLGARSWIGMPAELLVRRETETELLFDTFVQTKNPLARAVWAATEPGHPPVVRHMLGQAAGRVVTGTGAAAAAP